MKKTTTKPVDLNALPPELRRLVRMITDSLGQTIAEAEGDEFYLQIDLYRKELKKRRGKKSRHGLEVLLNKLDAESAEKKLKVAHAFSLLLELMNVCETSYRTWRQQHKSAAPSTAPKVQLTYVLTAHPTEARSKTVLSVLRRLTQVLIEGLQNSFVFNEAEIMTYLRILWAQPLVKSKPPTVLDEAEYIYSLIFAQPVFDFIASPHTRFDLKLRTWVGGDKDGHPGVNAKVMLQCLSGSRHHLLDVVQSKLQVLVCDLENLVEVDPDTEKATKTDAQRLSQIQDLKKLVSSLASFKEVAANDGSKVTDWKKRYQIFLDGSDLFSQKHHAILIVNRIFEIFPGLVLPLELREDAAEIQSALDEGDGAIAEMLRTLKEVSKGVDFCHYARGLVISHCESGHDLDNAIALIAKHAAGNDVPVIPLFESGEALASGAQIMKEWLGVAANLKRVNQNWHGQFEVMLGYSDSSKQVGVLPSRYLIRNSMDKIDQVLRRFKVIPVFFHGSGGSIARGGGSLREQIEWWPNSAVARPKQTIQGEMIQRLFATKEILNSQATHLSDEAGIRRSKSRKAIPSKSMDLYVAHVRDSYTRLVSDTLLLTKLLEASPYAYLEVLKIGSRPTKRPSGEISTSSLRAIPWVLCWTQTRLLMPSWWGTGAAWKLLTAKQKSEMKSLYKRDPFLSSFVKTLGFTLAKVELPVWEEYMNETNPKDRQLIVDLFRAEFESSMAFLFEITDEKDLLWYRPWLEESIHLRAPYIHILNLLQILAMRSKDERLLKETLVGIASGMLTTG